MRETIWPTSEELAVPSRRTHVTARANLLAALEVYAAALESTGRPLPYRLRDELHLQRRMSGSRTNW